MKKSKFILIAILAITLLSFTLNKSVIFQENLEDIGIIKQSLLKPNQFNKTQKGSWVLLNGQEIDKESSLYKLLEDNVNLNILTKKNDKYFLPNAAGAFIRSSNVNGEGLDPEENRLVGSIQNDTIKSHSVESEKAYYGHRNDGFPRQDDHNPGHWVGRLKVKSNYVGSSETRPVNISMYTYIKID